jgi:hypothetical protein
MDGMCKLPKRSDDFYFIEVWDKQKLRGKKIGNILGEKSNRTKPKYLTGGYTRPVLKDKIYFALFWKRLDSAQNRVTSMKNKKQFTGSDFVIRKYTRKQFIKIIPGKIDTNNMNDRGYFDKNRKMKIDEIRYVIKYEKAKKLADLEFQRTLKS